MASADSAVADYLRALKDPSSLRDDDNIAALQNKLDQADDMLERVRLRQQLLDAQSPSLERYEDGFLTHAQAWAEEQGVSAKAFTDEGVSDDVLRRAGFAVEGGRRARGRPSGARQKRSRVTVAEVRQAIPSGTFTIKQLQEASGASPAVVRKVVSEDEASGALTNTGSDPDHRGPGRSPVLYRKA